MIYRAFVSNFHTYTYVPIDRHDEEWYLMEQWCIDLDHDSEFSMGGWGVYFENKQMAELFILRWVR